MCKNPDCDRPATISGYCRRCYMRKRRHGDASTVKPAGRPKADTGDALAVARELFPEMSPRTQARWSRAFYICQQIDAMVEGGTNGRQAYRFLSDRYNAEMPNNRRGIPPATLLAEAEAWLRNLENRKAAATNEGPQQANGYHRHLARDRLMASLHEAAHVVVARYFDVKAQAYLVPTGATDIASSKTVVGSSMMNTDVAEAGVKLRIAAAGAVGEAIRLKVDADDYDEVHSRMSDSDCRLCDIPTGCETFPDWASCDEEAQHLRDAIDDVNDLLTGQLRSQWLEHARHLRVSARTVIAQSLQFKVTK